MAHLKKCIQKASSNQRLTLKHNWYAARYCCAAAMEARAVQKHQIHNMPRGAARQKLRFSIIGVSRQAVRLVLLDIRGILCLHGC
mgnify:CR=1 FL=1